MRQQDVDLEPAEFVVESDQRKALRLTNSRVCSTSAARRVFEGSILTSGARGRLICSPTAARMTHNTPGKLICGIHFDLRALCPGW